VRAAVTVLEQDGKGQVIAMQLSSSQVMAD
jgi:hypothetical protein